MAEPQLRNGGSLGIMDQKAGHLHIFLISCPLDAGTMEELGKGNGFAVRRYQALNRNAYAKNIFQRESKAMHKSIRPFPQLLVIRLCVGEANRKFVLF